jgi:predicted ATP-grasp superfamily ATP-dependent carboligase
VRTPRTRLIKTVAEAEELAGSIGYPAVLKARSSEIVGLDGVLLTAPSRYSSAFYACDRDQFVAAYEKCSQRCSEVVAQEYVDGAGAGYFALMRYGELRADFAHMRIRDVYPTGSGSSLRISVRPDRRLPDAALSILRRLSWHGVAMVEFKLKPDGTPVFVEVNPLFWGSLALSFYSGVDFPALLARMVEDGDIEVQNGYRAGVRCRWLLGDFRHLIAVFRGAPAGFPSKFPGKFHTLVNVLKPTPGTFHDNFMVSDPLPEIGDWCHACLQFLGRR